MLSKNFAAILLPITFLAVGLIIGYSIAGNNNLKLPISDNPASDKPAAGETGQIDLTAREAYDIAISEARLWAADAHLSEINLASNKLDANGSASGWKFIFYSKIKNKLCEILIKDGESRGGKEVAAEKQIQTLKREFIDSAALAKSFFSSHPSDTGIIDFKMYYDSGNKKFIWTVFFPKGSQTIDAEI